MFDRSVGFAAVCLRRPPFLAELLYLLAVLVKSLLTKRIAKCIQRWIIWFYHVLWGN